MTEQRRRKDMPREARMALEEAEARRKIAPRRPEEHGGPRGPEPTRYGDWERNGIASDF